MGVLAVLPLFLIIGDVMFKGVSAIVKQLGSPWEFLAWLPPDPLADRWGVGRLLVGTLYSLWEFLTRLPPDPFADRWGIGPLLVGTLYMTALGAVVGFIVGFPIGVYIGEMRKEAFANVARASVNVLVEFPTITIGLFVYAVFVFVIEDLNRTLLSPLSEWLTSALGDGVGQFIGPLGGYNAYAGALALSIIMIPYVALVTASAYASIPDSIREAAYSISGREFKAMFIVLRKAVSRAVLTAALLGTAKIAGETAPLLFTALGNIYYAPFTQATAAIPLWIWYAAQTPYDVQIESAYGAAAVLLVIVLTLFAVAKLAAQKR
ncbi:ABC-type phosphate transport system, permease component [Pyrobaculum oguniense TE7]|uniref:ABC-type phosphate transport system, permease component n=1 Tax=Pyrobaculum oguniense (strain DSM 13380 / JCM 10595 / TE7) TaxID=698757 RepID=H6QB23_PYROT|nr:ABC-type phosphate transport system, permease component [Pyrobaculum oguniense TE7]